MCIRNIRTIRNGQAGLTHQEHNPHFASMRKIRNISNHKKHNIIIRIIRNIRNANTMHDPLGFSSIAKIAENSGLTITWLTWHTARIQKYTGQMPAYICKLTYTSLHNKTTPLNETSTILLESYTAFCQQPEAISKLRWVHCFWFWLAIALGGLAALTSRCRRPRPCPAADSDQAKARVNVLLLSCCSFSGLWPFLCCGANGKR